MRKNVEKIRHSSTPKMIKMIFRKNRQKARQKATPKIMINLKQSWLIPRQRVTSKRMKKYLKKARLTLSKKRSKQFNHLFNLKQIDNLKKMMTLKCNSKTKNLSMLNRRNCSQTILIPQSLLLINKSQISSYRKIKRYKKGLNHSIKSV